MAAYGYQIDLLHRNIVKTSIIDIVGEYQDVIVYSNDEEVANKVPYQIKSIKPGTYKLDIESEKYLDWNRSVEVIEDFVTIVDDLFLIPKDLEPFTITAELEFIYDDVLFNGHSLLFVNQEKGVLRKMNIGNENGEFSTVTFLSEVLYEELYTLGSRYIVFEDDNIINLYDLSSNEFTEIIIPDEFTNFSLGYTSSLQGIYINNESLFAVDISEQGVFNEITLLEEMITADKLKVYSEGDYTFLKLDNDLYEYRDHLVSLIASEVVSAPKLSPFGNEVLYVSEGGEIHNYSFETLENILIGRFAKKVDYVSWMFDGKHIFIVQNGDLLLCDLTMDNCPIVLNEVSSDTIYIPKIKPLMVMLTQEGISTIDLKFE